MPLATERLTRISSRDTVKKAISTCISQLSHEHPDWEQDRVVAACYNSAQAHAGKHKVPQK